MLSYEYRFILFCHVSPVSVFSCADVEVPEGAWYKRDGDFARVGCEKEDLSWALHCEGTEWKGSVGTCHVEGKPISVINILIYILLWLLCITSCFVLQI